jgi:VWFA-related protein
MELIERFRMIPLRYGALTAALALCLLPLQAQVAPSPDAPPVSTAPDVPPVSEAPITKLKINVNLVNFYFTARDKRNALVADLTREDCSVFENKQPQTIKSWTAEATQPLTLGILLDTSGSQQRVLPMEQEAAGHFLRDVLRSKDEAFLVTFDVGVNLEQDYTNDVSQLERALNRAEINTAGGNGSFGVPGLGQGPVPTQGAPKGTLLYDAVYQVSNTKLRSESGRKALILLTDGQDEGSLTKPAAAIAAAEKANAIIYVILIADRGQYRDFGLGYTGDLQMKRLTDETGGRLINVGNNGQKMEAAFRQIAEELRTQYVLSYTPSNSKEDGSFRKVDIFCKGDGLKVEARKGYYALAEASP